MNVYVELSRRFNEGRLRAILAGGWSAHLEFQRGELRVRTDFVTRPPRLTAAEVARLWQEPAPGPVPFLDARLLARQTAGRSLRDAHRLIVARAEGVLPFTAEVGHA